MTQNEKVLRHLQEHRSITPLDALKEYSIMRLASRISDLKRSGFKITNKIETSKNSYGESVRYSVYSLAEEKEIV